MTEEREARGPQRGRFGGVLGSLVGPHFARQDLAAAQRAAQGQAMARPEHREAGELAGALGRLEAEARAFGADASVDVASTEPLSRAQMAVFQVCMGNLAEAELLCRNLVLDAPEDAAARQRLEDVQCVRRLVEGEVDGADGEGVTRISGAWVPGGPLPGEPTTRTALPGASPEDLAQDTLEISLDAVTREVHLDVPSSALRTGQHPQATGAMPRIVPPPPPGDPDGDVGWDDDTATELGTPEAEADSLLEAGQPERALAIYEELARIFPKRTDLARRAEQVRAMLARGTAAPPPAALDHPTRVSLRKPPADGPVAIQRIIKIP